MNGVELAQRVQKLDRLYLAWDRAVREDDDLTHIQQLREDYKSYVAEFESGTADEPEVPEPLARLAARLAEVGIDCDVILPYVYIQTGNAQVRIGSHGWHTSWHYWEPFDSPITRSIVLAAEVFGE